MKTLLALAASLAFAAPAAAVTYDVFADFNGTTNPSGVFTYGQTDGITFTPFTSFSNCEPGLRCLTGTEFALGVYANTTGAAFTAFSTVDVPADALFLHPGPSLQAYVLFTSPTTAVYELNFSGQLLSNSTITGVTLSSGFIIGSSVIPLGSVGLTAVTPSFSTSGLLSLGAGESLFIAVGNAGDFQFDSTQIGLTLTEVPEPASWALLIAGFGLTGAAMRRRRIVAAA